MTKRWHDFWFAPESTNSLCMFRRVWGLILCLNLTGMYGMYRVPHMRPDVVRYTFEQQSDYFLDGFHLPVPGFDWLPVPTLQHFQWLETALLLLAVCLMLGLATRFVLPVLCIGYFYRFLISQFLYFHHVWCLALGLLILAMSRCDEHYSVDQRGLPRPRIAVPRRLLQCLVTIIYFFSAASKMNPAWVSGSIFAIFRDQGDLQGMARQIIPAILPYSWAGCGTIVIEACMVWALWNTRCRPLAFLMGAALHLGIDAGLDARTFSYEMIALYIPFLNPDSHQTEVLAPPQVSAWIRRLDWLGRLRFTPSETVSVAGHHGWKAWLRIGLRCPLTFPLCALPATLTGWSG